MAKRLVLGALAGTATFLAAFVAVSEGPWGADAQDDPAVATPGPAAGPGADPAGAPPGLDPPGAVLVELLDLAGMAVHVTRLEYHWSADTASPLAGQEIFGDTWLEFDSAGVPTAFIGIYSLADGTVVQTITQDRESETVQLGQPVPSGRPDGSMTCSHSAPSSIRRLLLNLPPVVTPLEMERGGYARSGDTWARAREEAGFHIHRTVTVDEIGRVLAERTVVHDAAGALAAETRIATLTFTVHASLPEGRAVRSALEVCG